MYEVIKNKLNFETIDLLDKLIEPSEFMEKSLEQTLKLKFKPIEGNENWILNEDLKTFSPISFRNGEDDKYTTKIIYNYDVLNCKNNGLNMQYYLDMEERFIPNREETPQNILLSYLKYKLVDNGEWKMFGPKTLIHDKTDDKILVYVRPDTIHIVHDGECVIDNFSINYFNFHPSEVNEYMLNEYLQDVLHHF